MSSSVMLSDFNEPSIIKKSKELTEGKVTRLEKLEAIFYFMRGIFPSFVFPFMPGSGGHSWIDVEIEGVWKPIDSYINDKAYKYSTIFQIINTRR